MFAEQSSGASTYWAAVVSAVPVLGLAMVIEARRIAARWSLSDHPLGRTMMSLGFLYQVGALVFAMAQGLTGLASGRSTESVSSVNYNLIAVTAIVLVTPLLDVFLRTNPDVLLFLLRVPPWSSWSRQRRRLRRSARAVLTALPAAERQHRKVSEKAERSLKEFEAAKKETLAQRAQAERIVEEARAQVAHLPEHFRQSVEQPARQAEAFIASLDQKLARGTDASIVSARQLDVSRDAMAAAQAKAKDVKRALQRWHAWSFDEDDRTRLQDALDAAQTELRNQPS